MKCSYIQRSKKSWTAIIDLGLKPDGKRNQKWITVPGTKKDAQTKAAEIIAEFNKGTYIEPAKTNVKEFLDHWLKTIKSNIGNKTHERYQEIINHHISPYLGQLKLNNLKPVHITGLYADLLDHGRRDGKGGLSKRSVLHAHRIFREALNDAVKWEILARNPCDAVEPPTPEKSERLTFATDETLLLLDKARQSENSYLYLAVLIAVTTGLRLSEVIGLRWKDIDLDKARLSVRQVASQTRTYGIEYKEPKTQKSTRMIPLQQITVNGLNQYRLEQARIFLQLGKRITGDNMVFDTPDGLYPPRRLTVTYRMFIKKHGFKHVTFHDLRHSHATQLLEQNIHPKIVSERLGHSTIALTMDTYSHVLPSMQESAISVMDQVFNKAKNKAG